eukprot:4505567-Ditylum_brightwellii.AAC.1
MVDFHPQSSKLPRISAAEAATHAAKDLSASLTGPNTNAPFAVLGDEQLQAIHKLAGIFQKATQTGDNVQPPRVMSKPVQSATIKEITPLLRVQTNQPISKPTMPTPSLRVIRHNSPHAIPLDDDSVCNLLPPRPHPILVPTPKCGLFYIPTEEDDIRQGHRYPTGNGRKHRANFWTL